MLKTDSIPNPFGFGFGVTKWSILTNSWLANKTTGEWIGFWEGEVTQLCALGTKAVDGRTWGHFSGRMISLHFFLNHLRDFYRSLDAVQPRGKYEKAYVQSKIQGLFEDRFLAHIDVSEATTECPEHWDTTGDDNNSDRMKWLLSKFAPGRIVLLGLASFQMRTFGLLLVQESIHLGGEPHTRWRRLGYCQWDSSSRLREDVLYKYFTIQSLDAWERDNGDFLRGEGEHWTASEGLFG